MPLRAVAALTSVAFTAVTATAGLAVLALTGARAVQEAETAVEPSPEAVLDIPAVLLPLFIDQAAACDGLPWTVLAGISRVESNHGRHGGASINAGGVVTPPIIGVALDGTAGTARILDTDRGRWDGDVVFDRAVGPFQFIPTSWRIFGGDGNGDGVADPHNVYDAVPAMRRHLCPEGQINDLRVALLSYNNSDAYVDDVLDWAGRYTAPAAKVSGAYALPVPSSLLDAADLVEPHHDYPAWDAAVPVGTPLFAITDGTVATASTAGVYPTDPNRCGSTVAIAGADGAHYIYCHLSIITVNAGQPVTAGTLLGYSGGQPGTLGSGNTTGPHLHLGVRVAGRAVCPQPILLAIHRRAPIPASSAPSSGCTRPGIQVDWTTWLRQNHPAPTAETGASHG